MAVKCGTYTIPSWSTGIPGDDAKIYNAIAKTSGLQPDFAASVNSYINYLAGKGFTCTINENATYKNRGDIDDMKLNDESSQASIGCGVYVGLNCTKVASDTGSSADDLGSSQAATAKLIAFLNSSDADLGEYGLAPLGSAGIVDGLYMLQPANRVIDPDATDVSYAAASDSSDSSTSSGSSTATATSVAYWVLNNVATRDQTGMMLTGVRALINDEPIYNTIKTYANGAMRTFCTAPDGSFVAFYPDKWGLYTTKDAEGNPSESAYLHLSPMEMTDFSLQQSDANFTSHVYCHGVYADGSQGTALQMWALSKGYVSVESRIEATESDMDAKVTGASEGTVSTTPSELLQKIVNIPAGQEYYYSPAYLYKHYGARPYTTVLEDTLQFPVGENTSNTGGTSDLYSNTVDQNQLMLFLQALYIFMEKWSSMFASQIGLTFMPELYPGMRIKVDSIFDKDGNQRDIQVYCESVTHNFSYDQSGFTTTATVSCPSGDLVPGLVDVKYTE